MDCPPDRLDKWVVIPEVYEHVHPLPVHLEDAAEVGGQAEPLADPGRVLPLPYVEVHHVEAEVLAPKSAVNGRVWSDW